MALRISGDGYFRGAPLESSRPVPTFTLGFLPGIIAGLLLFPDYVPVLLPVLLIAAAIAAFAVSAFRPGFIKLVLCGLITGLAAVTCHTGFYGRNHIRFHVDKIEGPVSVTGVITEPPISRVMLGRGMVDDNKQTGAKRKFSFADRQARGEIQIESVTMPDGKTANLHGRARIKFYRLEEFMPVGSRIRVTCNVYRPFSKSTPGGVDYRAFLARNKILANIVVSSRGEPEVLGRRGFHPLADLRAAMVRLTVSTFGENGKAEGSTLDFLLAILLGERRLLTNERRDAYITSGTAHFLAISGLHLALFAAFLGIALWFMPRRPRMLVIGIAVALYAAIAGFRPSVLRALIMILFYLGAVFFRRQRQGIAAIAAAAVFVLFVNPFDLLGPGFQLSFGGVLGIMFLARPLERLITRERDRLFERLAEPEFRPKGIRLLFSYSHTAGHFPVRGGLSFHLVRNRRRLHCARVGGDNGRYGPGLSDQMGSAGLSCNHFPARADRRLLVYRRFLRLVAAAVLFFPVAFCFR
jgi:ComEC/Rec2-related protein